MRGFRGYSVDVLCWGGGGGRLEGGMQSIMELEMRCTCDAFHDIYLPLFLTSCYLRSFRFAKGNRRFDSNGVC
jgi:hypothetical protein